ncbi:unnamed protein product [Linum trigynum]|uniref:SBP-type domain-containing protein n=1 Tax=Linum trigynum TaxID=586398 RepID=A0AAV2EUA7_9ROSI
MESCSYASGAKGTFVSSIVSSSSDTLPSTKSAAMWNWDLRRATPSGFGSSILVSTPNPILESQNLEELGYHELMAKPLPYEHDDDDDDNDDDSVRYHLNHTNAVESDRYMNPFVVANPYALSLEDESSSRLSGSVVDSNSRDSSFIDLELGRVGECQNSRKALIVSPSESNTPPKRARFGINSNAAYCQVYGCNKDLSSSKDYHKRHKVCEVHSKTAKVIVNGIEQRFCQQCSRFHLLAEFDDGKRSCRKRLAGHNERRRKPQVGIHSGRTARLIQSYNAAAGFGSGRLQETGLTSFICQDILPGSLVYPQKSESNHWSRSVKLEEESDSNMSALSAIMPITSSHLHSKFSSPHSFEKIFPPIHNSVVTTAAAGSIFSEHSNWYPHDVGGSSNSGSSSCSLPQDVSFGKNDDFINFDPASTIQELSGVKIVDSGCALSLLSSQSQSSSGIPPMAHHHRSFLNPNNSSSSSSSSSSRYDMQHQVSSSARLIRFGSHVSAGAPSTSADVGHLNPMFLCDLDGDTDGINQEGSHFMNQKDQRLSCEDGGHTIDLLQLSSQLHRVEREKQLKQEADAFCCPRII